MRAVDPMIAELEIETEATRKLLERVPEDKLTWKPHDKSMTLGQLAMHVARTPGDIAEFLELDELDAATVDFDDRPQPESKDEILQTLAERISNARSKLDALDDTAAMDMWTLKIGDQEVWSMPKIALARSLMLNHWYHHRGQLTVYLRMHDVPLPVIYGATADENPFLEMIEAQTSGAS